MVNHENFAFEKELEELFFKNRSSFIMVILCVAPVASRGFYNYAFNCFIESLNII